MCFPICYRNSIFIDGLKNIDKSVWYIGNSEPLQCVSSSDQLDFLSINMDFYTHPSITTVPTGRASTWFEAVNSEFCYEQKQIKDLNSNSLQLYGISAADHSVDMREQPLTALTTTEPIHANVGYYQRPISMHYNNGYSATGSYVGDGNELMTYAPCQGPRPWNFAQCYGFYDQPPCALLNIIDMEDFMWVL